LRVISEGVPEAERGAIAAVQGEDGGEGMNWITRFFLERYKRRLELKILTHKYDTKISRNLECVQYLLDRR
ncbi:MAG: hypothetical protein HN416_14065, partial [Nitrospina sp.]|nr:hypothetical protein [Nitrospina sp.]